MQKRSNFTTFLLSIILLCASEASYSQASITPADPVCGLTTASYITLTNIVITEIAKDDITQSGATQTLILTCPAGYQFNAGVGSVSFAAGFDVTAVTITVTGTTITLTVTTNGGGTLLGDKITISGIQVKATSNSALCGDILRSSANAGTQGIAGVANNITVFGTLCTGDVVQVNCVFCYNQNAVVSSPVTNLILNGGFENGCNVGSYYCPSSTNYSCDNTNWTCTGGGSNTYSQIYNGVNFSSVAEGVKAAYMGNYFCNACSSGGALPTNGDISCVSTSGCTVTGVPAGFPSNPNAGYGVNTGVSLQQSVSGLTAGNVYVLEFWAGGEGGYPSTGIFGVNFGCGYILLPVNATPAPAGVGIRYIIEFTPATSGVTVKFTNWGHICSTCSEIVLDDVRLYTKAQLSSSVPACVMSLTASMAKTDVLCNGGNNGTATATAVNGTANYTYNWSTGANTITSSKTNTISGLVANTYTVTITDGTSTTATAIVTVAQPAAITASASQTSPASCGNNNGVATATGGGGTGTYTYNWSNGSTTVTASNLAAGNYTVTVKDANNCSKTATTTISSATGPAITSVIPTNPLCSGSTGTAVASASGGTGTLTYTWNNAAAGKTASGLAAGTYTVTVIDAGGCTATSTTNITIPAAITASAAQNAAATCGNNDGSALLTASGGTGALTYSWSSGATTITASNLAAGNYTVTVTDANSCSKTATATIAGAAGPTITSVIPTNPLCAGGTGTAVVTATGGTGTLTYTWNNGTSGKTASGLAAGTYTVTVKDASGCSATSATTIIATSALVGKFAKGTANCTGCGCKEWIFVTASGGTSPYTYTWSGGYTKRNQNHLCPGNYSIQVVDKNGCSININITTP